MKNSGKIKDVNRLSAIIGIVILVVLVVGLLTTIVIVTLHTNAYLQYEESRIQDMKVESGASPSCPAKTLRKASKTSDAIDVKVAPEEVEIPNIDENGNCIVIDAAADNEKDCPAVLKETDVVVKFSNIKKDYELEISNNFNSDVLKLTSDGKQLNIVKPDDMDDKEYKVTADSYSFIDGNPQAIVQYTMNIYYTGGGCERALVRIIHFETPKFNFLSRLAACIDKQDAPNCKPFIYSDSPLATDYKLSEALSEIEDTDPSTLVQKKYNNSKVSLVIVSIMVIVLLIVSIGVAVIGIIKVRKGGALHENEIDEDYDEDTSAAYDEYEKSKSGEDESKEEVDEK